MTCNTNRNYNKRQTVLSSKRMPHMYKITIYGNKNLALGPRRGLTLKLTDQLTIDYKVTLTSSQSILSRQLSAVHELQACVSRSNLAVLLYLQL